MESRLLGLWLLARAVRAQFFGTDVEALGMGFAFIDLKPPRTYTLHDKLNTLYDVGSESRFRCVQMRMSMVTNTLEKKFQSDNLKCGMFVTELRGDCLGEHLHNLQLIFSDVLFSDRRVVTPALKAGAPAKSIVVPGNLYVQAVRIGWTARKGERALASLRLTTSDGKAYDLKCSDAAGIVETFTLSNMERIGGLYVSYSDEQISDLDFLYHRVQKDYQIQQYLTEDLSARLKTRLRGARPAYGDEEYAKTLKSNFVYSNELEDAFEVKGPHGDKSGAPFTDTFVFGHWVVCELYVWYAGERISGVQASVSNKFFPYKMFLGAHGATDGEPTKVVVPTDTSIESGEVLLAADSRPCGLAFKFRDNKSVELPCPGDSGKGGASGVLSLVTHETVVGLAGTLIGGQLYSLGLLTLVLNTEDIMTL